METVHMETSNLEREFWASPYGKKIHGCQQCGTCSASCPLTHSMDHAPRELFALIRDGGLDEALASNTPWYCVSCYHCVVRCPREIPVTDLMYLLKQLAVKAGSAPRRHKLPDLYRAFAQVVEQDGRMSETRVMARYAVRHPGDALRNVPAALRLLKRGRLALLPGRARPETLKAAGPQPSIKEGS